MMSCEGRCGGLPRRGRVARGADVPERLAWERKDCVEKTGKAGEFVIYYAI
jgi:hypothetical protein